MKRIFVTIGLLFMVCGFVYGMTVDIGVQVGMYMPNDSEIKDAYGSGIGFFPTISFGLGRFSIGAGYDMVYNQKGQVGLFNDDSTMKINGFEAFIAYRFGKKKISPYLKAGMGYYSYKQTFELDALSEHQVDDSQAGWLAAAGILYYPTKSKRLFFSGEIKYLGLNVTSGDVSVDLSGIRFSLGAALSLKL